MRNSGPTRKHFMPHKNLRNNHQQPWITHDIKRFRRRKQLAYNRAKATKSSVHWLHYKELKKTMQRECRKAFRNYMSNAICDPYQSGKKKKLYHYMKSLRSDYCGPGILCKDGTDYVDNQAKGDLNTHGFLQFSLWMMI